MTYRGATVVFDRKDTILPEVYKFRLTDGVDFTGRKLNSRFPNYMEAADGERYHFEMYAPAVNSAGEKVTVYWIFADTKGEEIELCDHDYREVSRVEYGRCSYNPHPVISHPLVERITSAEEMNSRMKYSGLDEKETFIESWEADEENGWLSMTRIEHHRINLNNYYVVMDYDIVAIEGCLERAELAASGQVNRPLLHNT